MEEQEIVEKPKIDILSKLLKVIIYILVISLVVIISTNLSIRLDIKNYDKVYGEKIDNKYYYFKENKERVEIKKFKDFYNKKIDKIDDKYVPLLYCNKKECLYINLSDKLERNNLYPKFLIIVLLLIIAILELIIYMKKEDPNKKKYRILYLILVIITVVGLGREVYDISNYYLTVNKNKNLVKGKVIGQRGDNRYVIKYEVDNKIYYIDSNTNNNNIYCNKKEVSKSFNKMNPFHIKELIVYGVTIVYLIVTRILSKKKNMQFEDKKS